LSVMRSCRIAGSEGLKLNIGLNSRAPVDIEPS
jgi:hypothetical protein